MRAVTTAEQTILEGADYSVHAKLEVETLTVGVYADLSSYFEDATITADIDQFSVRADIAVTREWDGGGTSVSPFIASTIDVGRGVRVYAATVALSATPVAGDWKLLFDGVIDHVSVDDPMRLACRDRGGALVDQWVQDATTYGSAGGRALHLVIQDLLDDWATGVAVHGTAPLFLITPYSQTSMSVADAVRNLAAKPGWALRYEWSDSAGAFQLTLYEPDRTPAATTWTFGPGDYFDVEGLDIDRENIRNDWELSYRDSSTGTRTTATASDDTSILKYGRRWARIVEADDSPIDTATEADDMLGAALADTKDPKAEQVVSVPLFWPIQLGDYYTFSANVLQYTVDQDWAVVGYTHRLSRNEQTTRIVTRGAPAGMYQQWRRQAGPPATVDIPDGSITTPKIADDAVTGDKLAPGAIDSVTPFADTIKPIEIVDVLPAPGTVGRIVFLTTDFKLYRDTGTAWTAEVPAVDISGEIVASQIADAAVSTAKFAAGIKPVEIVTSLPTTGNTEGRIVYLTTTDKLYRYTGSAWTAAVPTTDLTGTIGATQITDSAITTAKLAAGAVTAAKIAADSITAGQIAAGAISTSELAAGAITAVKIAAGTITSDKIAANTITAGNIAAATITGSKIAAGTITASNIAANTLTAGVIAAGAIGVSELAADAVTAAKIAAQTLTSITYKTYNGGAKLEFYTTSAYSTLLAQIQAETGVGPGLSIMAGTSSTRAATFYYDSLLTASVVNIASRLEADGSIVRYVNGAYQTVPVVVYAASQPTASEGLIWVS